MTRKHKLRANIMPRLFTLLGKVGLVFAMICLVISSSYGLIAFTSPLIANRLGEKLTGFMNAYVISQKPGTYPFKNTESRHIGINATFTNPANHKSVTVPCILDTGAPSGYLSQQIYTSIGLDIQPNKQEIHNVETICRSEPQYLIDNIDVAFNGNVVKNIPTFVDASGKNEQEIFGDKQGDGLCLIGRSYLDNFVYTIDAKNQLITFK